MGNFKRLMIAGLAALWLTACAGDVEDIDRTQPNLIKKSQFDGDWYYRPTIIEAQYNQGYLFEGLEGDMDRVKWRLEEDTLTAYRSFEMLENAESEDSDVDFYGNPIAAFSVSHIDVFREYNPATGEQTNVIVEDVSTRPWYEREHVRVDWSTNLISDPGSIAGFINYMSASHPYYIQEHEYDNPHRAEIKPNSINIVGQYILAPDLYTCIYTLGEYYHCGGSLTKVKMSFLKIENRDYEPLAYPDHLPIKATFNDASRGITEGKALRRCKEEDLADCREWKVEMFERFGFFRTSRQAWDDEFQLTRDNRIRWANRWNIWKKTYAADGRLIPMSQRWEGEVVYHTNVDFPKDSMIKDATDKLVKEWDDSFRKTVYERRKTFTDQYKLEDINPIYKWAFNSCSLQTATSYAQKNDHGELLAEYGISTIKQGNLKRACSLLEWASNGEFTWQKPGDLRYSFLHWVDTPMQSGPLGYGPSAADPVTGELISGNANIYGAAIDRYAAYAADLVTMMNDGGKVADILNGTNVREELDERRKNANASQALDRTLDELSQRGGSIFETRGNPDFERLAAQKLPLEHQSGLEYRGKIGLHSRFGNHDHDANLASLDAKLRRVAGSSIDKELLTNDEFRRVMGPKKAAMELAHAQAAGEPMQLTADQIQGTEFSALSYLMDSDFGKKQAEARRMLRAKSIMMADEFGDDGMLWIAQKLKDEGKDWQGVYDYMRARIYEAVMAHEVGHTLGLRHNFEGSMDPLNFRKEYWANYNPETERVLKEGAVNPAHTGDIDEIVGGKSTGQEAYKYSTIMDYDARFYADSFKGIGLYDEAAIAFGYGGLIEVFAKPDGTPMPPFNGQAGSLPLYFTDLLFFTDYNDLPKLFDPEIANSTVFQNVIAGYNAGNTEFNRAINQYLRDIVREDVGRDTEDTADDWDPTPNVAALHQRKYVTIEDFYQQESAYYNAIEAEADVPNRAMEAVPYKFCPDERSWESNIACQTWDKGANFTEVMDDRALRHKAYYALTNLRRDRFDWGSYNSHMARLQSRFFNPMSTVFRNYLYSDSSLGSDSSGQKVSYGDFGFGRDWARAALTGMNYLASVLNQPAEGKHCLKDGVYVHETTLMGEACSSPMTVDGVAGRNFDTAFSEEYYYKVNRIGYFWDKIAALFAITSNEGSFYRDFSDYLDSGSFTLSYWRKLQPEMLELFGNGMKGTPSDYAFRFDGVNVLPVDVKNISEPDAALMAQTKIAPSWSWTMRYWMALLPMARFNSYYDYTEDFNNHIYICLKGYRDCRDFGNGIQEFVHPVTGLVYQTPNNTADGQKMIGAEFLTELNSLKGVYENAVGDEAKEAALMTLNQHVGFVEILRDMSYTMEWGG